jgi:hypothetical protein
MKRTNFDRYLADQLKDPAFAARFDAAGEAWEVSLQLAALRQQAGPSQKELARKLKTSQQWREANPKLEGNMREYATIEQLLVLANIEGMNAEFIHMGLLHGE